MKGVGNERRNEKQGGIVKVSANNIPIQQNWSKHSAQKQKEGSNTGYGNKVAKSKYAWDNGVLY